MSEEKDVAQVEAEMAALEARGGDSHNGVGPKGASGGDAVPPQLEPSEGLPERKAARRRQERVARMLHEFEPETQEAIRKSLPEDLLAHVDSGTFQPTKDSTGRHWAPESRRERQQEAKPDARPDAEPDDDADTDAEPAGAGARFPWFGRSRGGE